MPSAVFHSLAVYHVSSAFQTPLRCPQCSPSSHSHRHGHRLEAIPTQSYRLDTIVTRSYRLEAIVSSARATGIMVWGRSGVLRWDLTEIPSDMHRHTSNTPATPRRHPGDAPATPRRHPGDTPATPRRHPCDTPAAPRRHPGGTPAVGTLSHSPHSRVRRGPALPRARPPRTCGDEDGRRIR
eukprot:gene15655-biopygen8808